MRGLFFQEFKKKMNMHKLMKNRLALSTVITTLIILVVSVLLAGVVTYFAINVVSTRVQQESVAVDYSHIWCDSSGNAIGGVVLTNTGGRDVVINQVQVRGQPAGTMYSYVHTGDVSPIGATALTTDANFKTATLPLVLPSGTSVQIMIVAPGSVSAADIGTSIGFTVFTAQASYYHETNVQASSSSLA
jgi:type IV pilin